MSWGIVFRASQTFKSSLWIVPFTGAVVGLVLAEVGVRLDAAGVLPAYRYSAETATAVLSATIGAAASLMGFVIMVTGPGPRRGEGEMSDGAADNPRADSSSRHRIPHVTIASLSA